jgi:hypothetical protein
VAAGPGDWNNAANWSFAPYGPGGWSVPASTNVAIFDGGGTGDCTINATVNVGGINIGAGYSGTISQGAVNITVGSTGWTQAGGTFTGSSSTIALNGAFALSGGTFTCGNQTITSAGFNWTYTAGTIAAGASTVIFTKGTAPQTISGSHALNNVTFRNSQNTAQTIDFASGTTLTITGTTTFDSTGSGSLAINTGTIEAQGNVVVADALVYLGTTAFNLTGTANQTFTSSGGSGTFRFSPVTINKASGTVTLGSNLQLNNAGQDLTWTSGGLDLSSNTLTVADQVTIAAGATTLGVTVAGGAPTNGRLTCNGAVSDIGNVTLAMNITATAPQLSGQTYTILSRPAAVFSTFESESWSGDWTGDIAYNANGNTEVRLSNILETTGTAPSIDNLPPTSVTTVGASFNGKLVDVGTEPTTVSVRWANTEAALTGVYSSYAWNEGDWGNNSFPVYSGASLTANLDYYYTFVAQSTVGTTLATPAQYLITGELTPATGDGTCGATVADTATITISRPSTCKAGQLTVNYALSGAGTGYVSASPASGFTLAAGQESTNIVFTPLSPNFGAPVSVTLTMLSGAYASDGLDSDSISVATAVGYTLTANTDTSIGTAMDVVETPPNTVAYSLAGSTYTYEFWASSLNLNGKRVYNTTGGRSVVLQNLAVLTDSGAGRIDTSTTASFTVGGGVTVQAAGGITLNGANGSGYAIDSSSTTPTIVNRYSGGEVTLMTSGGVSLSAGGVRTEGKTGGRIWITDGAGGSAGNVSIAGNLYAASTENSSDRDGSVQVRGAAVTIAGNVVTTASGTDTPGKPITLIASGPLSVGGYLAAEQSRTANFGGSGGAVTLSGTTVTVSGSLSDLSINTSAKINYGSNVGGDIQVTATAGDLTLAGGVDASHPSGVSRRGAVALSAPGGNILVGSLDASKFKSISVAAGGTVRVTGVITNFTKTETPAKTITFPANSVIGNDIYYETDQNTAYPLTGDYAIYADTTNTDKLLKEQTKGSVFRFR